MEQNNDAGGSVFSEKRRALEEVLSPLLLAGPLGIACSGGLDSRFLSRFARLVAERRHLAKPLLAHVEGPHVPESESRFAAAFAASEGLALFRVSVNPLLLPEVAGNGRERCYHCKLTMFKALFARLRKESGVEKIILCDGSNASDREGYRPGLKALRELGVRSPLDEAGFTKADIRAEAAAIGLSRADQAARPCLMTRFPYGVTPTLEALREVATLEAQTERFLSARLACVPDFRLRAEGDGWFLQLGDCPADVESALLAALGPRVRRVVRTDRPGGYFDREHAARLPLK